MGIASRKPIAEVPTQPSTPQIQAKSYKGVVYDDKNTPLHSLIAYVSGSPWSVNFYSQVLGAHNELREIDPGQSGVVQQYQKTIGLEIRVNEALTSSYDATTGITTVSGSATMYPFMRPNVSDYFVSETADNQLAIFRITQVDRKTFTRDSVFTVNYDLLGYVNVLTEIYTDLESKVIKSFHFSKDRLLEGLSPTLKTEEFAKVMNLKVLYKDLALYYFKNFFNQTYGTLVIPGQANAYYDPYIVAFLMRMVDTTDAPEIRSTKQIPTDSERFIIQSQFWELLSNKDFLGKRYSNNVMGLVNKALFNRNSFVQGLAFSNIGYVVYPITADSSAFIGDSNEVKLQSMESLIDTEGKNGTLYSAADNILVTATKTYELIKEVLVDNYYVLSSDFYRETENMSVLEILVKDFMKGNTLDLNLLYAVTDKYRQWKRLEQFYYGPILMALVKEADRAQY